VPSSAEKLFEKAQNTQSGWKRQEIDRLYIGFGFTIRHGQNHDIVSHPNYPDLRATLPRQKIMKPVYVRQAVRLIDALLSQQENN
jgi:hypothetical protein